MPEDVTVYRDEEMELILREAAELSDAPTVGVGSSEGLTLEQIKAIAMEVGIDPAHVEQAARRIPRGGRESAISRLIGGPVRHQRTVHLQTEVTEERTTRVLAAVRAMVDEPGEGHADAFGMSWHSRSGRHRISVSLHGMGDGTSVRVRIDRGRSLVQTVFWSQLAIVMPIWMLIGTVNSYGDLAALALIPAVVLALARIWWTSSTRAVGDQVATLLATVAESVADSGGGSDASED